MKRELKLIFIISFIIVLIIGLGIFFAIKELKSKPVEIPNNKTTETANKFGKYNSEKELKDVLANSFNLYSRCNTGKDFNLSNDEIATIDNLDSDNILYILLNYLNNIGKIKREMINKDDGSRLIIKQDDMLQGLNDIFGQNYAKNYHFNTTFNFNGGQFTLNNNEYNGIVPIYGCMSTTNTNFYNYNSYFQDNTFNVEYALYWNIYDYNNGLISKIYKYSDSKEPVCLEDEIEDNLDKFTKYRFVFVREDDNFIFDHVELVK